ncbi:MAG: site-2 protease family protein [Candidatus Korobacteraceae bacterium]
MNVDVAEIFFQAIAFLFAVSVHESAHAWTANRCGDPTARMLGRISLNPIKHIDPIGTILFPALAMISGIGFIGWAKPVPVNPQNFSKPMRDDVLTSVAGPVSNFLVAFFAVMGLAFISAVLPGGREAVVAGRDTGTFAVPLVVMLHAFLFINILLAVFNLIPIPPLDGSHVLRHMLPERARNIYDTAGLIGLFLLMFVGGRILNVLLPPFERFFYTLLGIVT